MSLFCLPQISVQGAHSLIEGSSFQVGPVGSLRKEFERIPWEFSSPAGLSTEPTVMAADTISGYIQRLLDRIEFKQTAYALDRGSRKAALARFLKRASSGGPEEGEEERRLAA